MALPTVTTRVPKILIALTLRMTLDIIVPAVKVIEAMLIFAMAVKILMSAKLEKARCAQQAECKNTAGAYYCSCPKGYLVDGTPENGCIADKRQLPLPLIVSICIIILFLGFKTTGLIILDYLKPCLISDICSLRNSMIHSTLTCLAENTA
ncbi:hypothetical protein LWI28_015207 [Acer negundo]|uniref:NELL2-like EGF domain-containing protein n=1 Tax=Acer negundo TaxID=4023 RepID=A0AAD5JHZ4_ACENE|nr:hypothetical protein LWI28_015207 [Acer negundo]